LQELDEIGYNLDLGTESPFELFKVGECYEAGGQILWQR
jgi:hypothetical protein